MMGATGIAVLFFLRPPYDQTIKKKQNRKKYLHFSKLSRLQNKIMVMDHHLKKAILYNFYSDIKKKDYEMTERCPLSKAT